MQATCGWWGFPNQVHHEGLFTIARDQMAEVTADSNVIEVRIFTRQAGNWIVVWQGRTGQAYLLRGEYKVDCSRDSSADAKASVNYVV